MRIAALLGAVLLVVGPVGPARADRGTDVDAVQVSSDGRTWSDRLRQPLFDPGFRWVPGDREVRSFWVRNNGPSEALLRVDITTDNGGLLSDEDVELALRVDDGPWAELPGGADATGLIEDALAQRERVRVDVRIDFRWASPNASMSERAGFALVVNLREAPDVAGERDDDHDALPATGSEAELWLIVLGAAMVGSGVALVAGRRGGGLRHG
ncbi:hypothetical protein GCM10022263_31580 [Nocardioides daeguensis]|uniref:Gram-positive cocci surface proteins LPxTG domain-containing protein n=2 Tax=Nocardioides daeguensis TaxID=908359 RepID=A0ABP6VXQ8_9ACTN